MRFRVRAKYVRSPPLQQRIWRLLWLLFVFLNVKSLPLVWHYRFFVPVVSAALRKPLNHSILRRIKNDGGREWKLPLVFLPIITTSRVSLLEGDFNFHKSNSTYFTDLDTSRSHLLSFLCFHGLAVTDRELAAEGKQGTTNVMLGSTYTHFKREIPTGHAYEVWSRILTWDQKWVYLVTHFVRKGKIVPRASVADLVRDRSVSEKALESESEPESESKPADQKKPSPSLSSSEIESSVYATSISKCVFKKGRLTVSPERILRASGLLSNVLPSDTSPFDLTSFQASEDSEEGEQQTATTATIDIEKVLENNKLPAQRDHGKYLAAQVEAERCKSLRFAELLSGLEDLHGTFLKDEEVLNGVITLGTFTDMGRRV